MICVLNFILTSGYLWYVSLQAVMKQQVEHALREFLSRRHLEQTAVTLETSSVQSYVDMRY